MSVKQAKRVVGTFNLVVIVIVLIVLAFNSIYFIQEREQAVLVTFGRASVVDTPGIHLKIPFVQEVNLVSVEIHGMSIGYQTTGGTHNYVTVSSESLMITSDFNFVNIDFFLQYQISDPERFMFASDQPVAVLRNLALSYIRDTVGTYPVDEVITTGRFQIQNEIREKLSNRLEREDIGLRVVNVIIQDSVPPTAEVTDAFRSV
jgi:membrane protease subunit HflK